MNLLAHRIAIVAITRGGARLGARLQDALPGAQLHVMERYAADAGGVAIPFADPVRVAVARLFKSVDGLILLVSLGAVVRLLVPLLKDKKEDPGVVVMDEAGRFAIAVLSGHLGGANDLARQAAAAVDGQAVITTASDTMGTLAVDLLGREFGWTIENERFITEASAAVVNEDPVGVFQEAGETGWWPADRPLPRNIVLHHSLEALAAASRAGEVRAALVITDRLLQGDWLERAVVYRPRTLAVGIGCNRGTPAEELADAVARTLAGHGLSCHSVLGLASVEAKRDEEGLAAYAARAGLGLTFYPAQVLHAVEVPNPSAAPLQYVGTKGVAEPAALLLAGADRLLVEKRKLGNVTVAVARAVTPPVAGL